MRLARASFGLLLFSLVLQPLIRTTALRFPGLVLNAWYAGGMTLNVQGTMDPMALNFLSSHGLYTGFYVSL